LNCGLGTNEWIIIPWKDMHSDQSVKDYGKYVSSSRVLSKWIDADGGDFERCLYEGKTGSKLEYLEKMFGVKAILVRKIVLINFRQDASYEMYDDNLLQGLPPFYGEPSRAAKAALRRAKDKELSKEVVHDFILRLKEASRFHRVDQLCQAIEDVDAMTGYSISKQVARLLTSRQQQQFEPEPRNTRPTRQVPAHTVPYDVEVDCNDNSNSDTVPLYVDTNTLIPQCSQAPLVSPAVEGRVEVNATSNAEIQRRKTSDIVPLYVDTDTLIPQCSQAPLVSPAVESSVIVKATSDAEIQKKKKRNAWSKV
jgi:hypothetical protein